MNKKLLSVTPYSPNAVKATELSEVGAPDHKKQKMDPFTTFPFQVADKLVPDVMHWLAEFCATHPFTKRGIPEGHMTMLQNTLAEQTAMLRISATIETLKNDISASVSQDAVIDPSGLGKVKVIGAGIAGLLQAIYLKQQGVDVEVFEKRPQADATSRGQYIMLRDDGRGYNAVETWASFIPKPYLDILQKSSDVFGPLKKKHVDEPLQNRLILSVGFIQDVLTSCLRDMGGTIHYADKSVNASARPAQTQFNDADLSRMVEDGQFIIDARGVLKSDVQYNIPLTSNLAQHDNNSSPDVAAQAGNFSHEASNPAQTSQPQVSKALPIKKYIYDMTVPTDHKWFIGHERTAGQPPFRAGADGIMSLKKLEVSFPIRTETDKHNYGAMFKILTFALRKQEELSAEVAESLRSKLGALTSAYAKFHGDMSYVDIDVNHLPESQLAQAEMLEQTDVEPAKTPGQSEAEQTKPTGQHVQAAHAEMTDEPVRISFDYGFLHVKEGATCYDEFLKDSEGNVKQPDISYQLVCEPNVSVFSQGSPISIGDRINKPHPRGAFGCVTLGKSIVASNEYLRVVSNSNDPAIQEKAEQLLHWQHLEAAFQGMVIQMFNSLDFSGIGK